MPDRALLAAPAGRAVVAGAALLVIAVAVGLALLWPDGSGARRPAGRCSVRLPRCC